MVKLLFFILLMTPCLSFGQFGRVTPERFNEYFTIEFLDIYIERFNSLKTPQEAQKALMPLMHAKYRKAFFRNWAQVKTLPKLRREGTTMIIPTNKTEIRVQIVNLLEQRYRINGKPWIHDWAGQPTTQREMISNLLSTSSQARTVPEILHQALFPEAEAFYPFLLAAEAAIWAAGGSSAVFVASRAPQLASVARQAGVVVGPYLQKAGEAAVQVVRNVQQWGSTSPTVALAAEALTAESIGSAAGAAVSTSARLAAKGAVETVKYAGRKIDQTIGMFTVAFIGSNIGTWNSEREAAGMEPWEMAVCLATEWVVKGCSRAMGNMAVSKEPVTLRPAYTPWCATKDVPESQTHVPLANGRELIKVVQVNPTTNKVESGFSFEVEADRTVKTQSFRYYKFDEKGAITHVTRPQFRLERVDAVSLLTEVNTVDDQGKPLEGMKPEDQTKEKKLKIAARENILKSWMTGQSVETLTTEQLAEFSSKPLTLLNVDEATKKEFGLAATMYTTPAEADKQCKTMKEVAEASKTSAPGPSTTTTTKPATGAN